MNSLPHADGLASPTSASAGALTVIQRGTQSTAMFVLNPSSADARVDLRARQHGFSGRLSPVTQTGSHLAADNRELNLEPWGFAVYRVDQSDG